MFTSNYTIIIIRKKMDQEEEKGEEEEEKFHIVGSNVHSMSLNSLEQCKYEQVR